MDDNNKTEPKKENDNFSFMDISTDNNNLAKEMEQLPNNKNQSTLTKMQTNKKIRKIKKIKNPRRRRKKKKKQEKTKDKVKDYFNDCNKKSLEEIKSEPLVNVHMELSENENPIEDQINSSLNFEPNSLPKENNYQNITKGFNLPDGKNSNFILDNNSNREINVYLKIYYNKERIDEILFENRNDMMLTLKSFLLKEFEKFKIEGNLGEFIFYKDGKLITELNEKLINIFHNIVEELEIISKEKKDTNNSFIPQSFNVNEFDIINDINLKKKDGISKDVKQTFNLIQNVAFNRDEIFGTGLVNPQNQNQLDENNNATKV